MDWSGVRRRRGRTWAVMSLLAGAVFGLLALALGGSLASALGTAALWTAVFAPVTFVLLTLLERRQGRDRPDDAGSGPDSAGVAELPADLVTVRDAVMGAAQAMDRVRLTSRSTDRLDFTTGVTWKSWGEQVVVRLHATPTGTRMQVRSTPRLATTLFDYGKGRSNVRTMIEQTAQRIDQDGRLWG